MPRRPLVGAGTLFVLGIAAGLWSGHAPVAAGAWCLAATVCLWQVRRPSGLVWPDVTILLLALATGWLAAADEADRRRVETGRLNGLSGRDRHVTVSGVICGDLDVHALAHGGARYGFALRQVAIGPAATAGSPVTLIPVQVNWYGPRPETGRRAPAIGERWAFIGTLHARTGMLNRVRATFTTQERASARLAPASWRDIGTLADRARAATADRLARGIANWDAIPTLVQAMFLGTRSDIPRELNRVFRDSGTIHIFAISGMNVALLALVLIALLSLLGVPRTHWCLPLAPILLFYTIVTGLSPSALRAFLMAVLYFGAPLLGRRPDGLSTLAAAAAIALAIHPGQLQDASFGLSFVVMGGLLLLYTPVAELFKRWLKIADAEQEARLSVEWGGELAPGVARRRRLRLWALRSFAELMAMSLSAWLSSMPLTAWYFGRLTPASLLANLPISPAAFLVGVASSVGLLAGLVSSTVEAVFNNAAGGLTWVMIGCARATVAIPGGALTIPTPPLWLVGCWYGALLLFTAWLWRVAHRPAGSTP